MEQDIDHPPGRADSIAELGESSDDLQVSERRVSRYEPARVYLCCSPGYDRWVQVEGVKVPQPIVYIDTSAVRNGKLEELEAAMKKLAVFVKANVPQLISYGFFLDEEKARMTVVAVHPDSASLEFHMDVGREEFRKFSDIIDLLRIDVYGRVSDAVMDRLHRKARMLGDATVAVHAFHEGFWRVSPESREI